MKGVTHEAPYCAIFSSLLLLHLSQVTLWSGAILVKLRVSTELVRKFAAFYETHRFFSVLVRPPPLMSVFIQTNPVTSLQPVSTRSILILFSHSRLHFPGALFRSNIAVSSV
jgi:hypothetical protein